MGFLTEHCSFHLLTREIIAKCKPFSCGNVDLDEFFAKDSPLYTERLLGKTYCYLLDEDPMVIRLPRRGSVSLSFQVVFRERS